jgi:hypothetical protein
MSEKIKIRSTDHRPDDVSPQRGVFLFVVTNANKDKQEFLVEMRKTGSFYLGKGPPKTKPDVTISVSDKDMVDLSTGKLNVSLAEWHRNDDR